MYFAKILQYELTVKRDQEYKINSRNSITWTHVNILFFSTYYLEFRWWNHIVVNKKFLFWSTTMSHVSSTATNEVAYVNLCYLILEYHYCVFHVMPELKFMYVICVMEINGLSKASLPRAFTTRKNTEDKEAGWKPSQHAYTYTYHRPELYFKLWKSHCERSTFSTASNKDTK